MSADEEKTNPIDEERSKENPPLEDREKKRTRSRG